MTWRTNKIFISLRNISRHVGLNSFLASKFRSRHYEEKFEKTLLKSVEAGDCVWDVGANVGYYSGRFSYLVGDAGKVCAFEPSPQNLNVLKANTEGALNVEIYPVALGAGEAKGSFIQGEDDIGATSHLVSSSQGSQGHTVYEVDIVTGDSLIHSSQNLIPNVIKIDVEGYELDVLLGFKAVLRQPALRVIGIEVHFSLLQGRGIPDAPREIETILQENGFRCYWPDASHITAYRNSCSSK